MSETATLKTEATELEWLTYFAVNADFGPAHSDVVRYMMRDFEKQTGKRVPASWAEGYIEDGE